MAQFSRRAFLAYTGAAGAAAAVASVGAAVPAGADSGQLETAAGSRGDGAAAPTAGEALVAHVRNLKTGEISLFSGNRLVTVYDRPLAARLVRASQ